MKNSATKRRLLGAAMAAVLISSAPSAAGTWSSRRPMEIARSHMGGAVLDGEVYVAGGTGILGPIAAFEAYDPVADHWRPLPSLPAGRQQFGMAAFDGRIVVTGGFQEDTPSEESAQMWVYDPRTTQWTQGPGMPDGRAGHTLVAVEDRLYVIGGVGKGAERIFVYHLKSRSWSVAPLRLPSARTGLAAAYLDGRIYVAGGRSENGKNSARLDILDLKSSIWRRGAKLPGARAGLTMAAIGGRLHIAGGSSLEEMRTYADHFSYDPGNDRWRREASMPTPRHSMISAQLDGRWYVMGGGSGVGFFTVFTDADVVEMYDPQAE